MMNKQELELMTADIKLEIKMLEQAEARARMLLLDLENSGCPDEEFGPILHTASQMVDDIRAQLERSQDALSQREEEERLCDR